MMDTASPPNGAVHEPVGTVRGAHGHYWLVACGRPGSSAEEAATEVFGWVVEVLHTLELEIVHERLFGSLSVAAAVMAARATAFKTRGEPAPLPVTYLEGCPPWGVGLAGVILHCVARPSLTSGPWMIIEDGIPRGRGWQSDHVTFMTLQGLGGGRHSGAPSSAGAEAISQADRLLRRSGCDYAAVARTWFYLDRILEWYGDFNRTRDRAYETIPFQGIQTQGQRFFPASTGIGGRSTNAGPCTLDVLAVCREQGRSPPFRFLGSSMQKDPISYGSAFSRAVSIEVAGGSLIQISGTAAIEREGKSLFPGDALAQMDYTLDVVASLLATHRVGLESICAATAFIKRAEDAPILRSVLTARGLVGLPAVVVVSDICREELLFELDGEAVSDG